MFFGSFLGFWWFCFFVSLCFCAFALYTIAQNGYFPAFLEVFCLFCSHKRPVFNCFFSSYFVFFAFVFPFKNPFFLCFLSINPFLEKILCGVSFVFLLLAFSFPNVCLFIWNKFLTSPFWNPSCFHFWQFLFFFCCSCFVSVHGVCFSLSVSMLALFLVFFCFCSVFLFLSCFLFCFQSMKKKLFFLQFWCFWVMLVKRVVWFLCFMFLFLFVFLVLLVFHFKEFICIIMFLCCCFCHKTKWSFLFASCGPSSFLFFVVLFWICLFFVFFIPLKKDPPPKNRTRQKPKKAKMQKKNGQKKIS